jgi:hypothetical protein
VLPAALAGLQDRDDDVRSAAADALYPVVGALAASAGDEDVRAVSDGRVPYVAHLRTRLVIPTTASARLRTKLLVFVLVFSRGVGLRTVWAARRRRSSG